MLASTSDVYPFADDVVTNLNDIRDGKTKRKSDSKPRPSILVVADELPIADTTTAVLTRSGNQAVLCLNNGHSALQIAAKLRPDYLLTDVLMPEMNGVELAIAIRREITVNWNSAFLGSGGNCV